ncbi:DUF1868 domain-containing protein [Gymnodinialimonas sp. 2305UL16-5]|uniref:DUF1868 domain-containing protein n=1 Tax=Gymnodinialimonas mytili TaxID=3126503 RepID=UPI0030A55C3F
MIASQNLDPVTYLTGAHTDVPRPPAVTEPGLGGKFQPTGVPLPYPGNTVLCHINQDSGAFDALVRLQDRLKQGPLAEAFTFLPQASLHMTVFDGISGPSDSPPDWPADISKDTPRDKVSEILLGRLSNQSWRQSFRISPVTLFAGHSLVVTGADAAETVAIADTRVAVRSATRLNGRNFDSYRQHITLAYLLRWLTAEEAAAVEAHAADCYGQFVAEMATSDIGIGPMEFCDFEDMHHFEPRALLTRP